MFLVFVGGPEWGGIEELFNLKEGGGRIVGGRGRGRGREGGRGRGRGRGREGEGGEEEWDVMTYQIRTTY